LLFVFSFFDRGYPPAGPLYVSRNDQPRSTRVIIGFLFQELYWF